MKPMFARVLLFILPALLFSFHGKHETDPIKVLGQMTDSIRNIKTLRMKIYALERIEKKFFSANSEIKLQVNPRKLYFINPSKKLEILYVAGRNDNKALVKPHVFPYLSVWLEPYGNMMRKNQHYTIHELGYEFIGKSVALTISKDKEGLKHFTYHGKVKKNGYTCHFLEYENNAYSYVDYRVGEKETVTSLAYKNIVNDYLVRYNNDLVNDFGYLKKGRVIRIPNLYCRKATIYIDERLMLPVAMSLYDDKGIFESYEFTEIKVNGHISEDEFLRGYREYHF